MKKIFFVSLLVLFAGVALGPVLAQNTAQNSSQPAQTEQQKACIKTAQDVRSGAIGAAMDVLNLATKDALEIKKSAIQTANNAFNKNQKAKGAKETYEKAIKKANSTYDSADTVKQAKSPYAVAVKAANDKYQEDLKACVLEKKNSAAGFFRKMGEGFSGFFGRLGRFFTGKK